MVRIFKCKKCGNLVYFLDKKPCTPQCCGEEMEELIAGTVDAAREKHIPVVEVKGSKVTVTVGEVLHPMLEVHLINYIFLETTKGVSVRKLDHTMQPVAEFTLGEDEKALAAYEYCNLHGLWMKEL